MMKNEEVTMNENNFNIETVLSVKKETEDKFAKFTLKRDVKGFYLEKRKKSRIFSNRKKLKKGDILEIIDTERSFNMNNELLGTIETMIIGSESLGLLTQPQGIYRLVLGDGTMIFNYRKENNYAPIVITTLIILLGIIMLILGR